MFEEANAELEEIDPFYRRLPETLLSRLAIYHGLEKWEPLAVVAKKLADWNPKEPGYFAELAYATKRGESIHAAHAECGMSGPSNSTSRSNRAVL